MDIFHHSRLHFCVSINIAFPSPKRPIFLFHQPECSHATSCQLLEASSPHLKYLSWQLFIASETFSPFWTCFSENNLFDLYLKFLPCCVRDLTRGELLWPSPMPQPGLRSGSGTWWWSGSGSDSRLGFGSCWLFLFPLPQSLLPGSSDASRAEFSNLRQELSWRRPDARSLCCRPSSLSWTQGGCWAAPCRCSSSGSSDSPPWIPGPG